MKNLITLLLLSLCLPANAADFKIVSDLPFVDGLPSLTLDLYLPTVGSSPRPCVIVIQGGGFASQNGQRFKPFAKYLAERGFAAALISYRGRPDHQYLQTMQDVRAAVRFVRRNSGKYNIDPKQIGATGRSAGGTLAALLAVDGKDNDPESHIQAAVCFAGVYDFISRFTDEEQLRLQPRHQLKKKTNGEWIGPPFSTADVHWQNASPVTHVDATDPPILLLHSKDDGTVPWLQARDMYAVMQEKSCVAELKLYDNGGHGVRPRNEDAMADMVSFFRRHLTADPAKEGSGLSR